VDTGGYRWIQVDTGGYRKIQVDTEYIELNDYVFSGFLINKLTSFCTMN